MCTVSFVPVKDKYILTSNRDEKNGRQKAIPPDLYEIDNCRLIFPKDMDFGGSWIALHENGNAAVLLNGAFQKHISRPQYRLSRGKIFLNVIASEDPLKIFSSLNLECIEPFTLVIVDNRDLYDCRWDGHKKYCRQLSAYRNYIWSSVTLYEKEIANKRVQWLESFLKRNPVPSQEDILYFHQFAGDGDRQNALQMERGGLFTTVSITSIMLAPDHQNMKYLDLHDHILYEQTMEMAFTT
jgi:uncharacterized protein with NRDE domain